MWGFEFTGKNKNKRLETTLNGFGIFKDNDELFVTATPSDFAKKQHNIIQALISVNDMFAPGKVGGGFFYDEVENFFNSIDARYAPNISI